MGCSAGSAPPAELTVDAGADKQKQDPSPVTDAGHAAQDAAAKTERDAAPGGLVVTDDGPTAHLVPDIRLQWRTGQTKLERNCAGGCIEKKMECRDATQAYHKDIHGSAVGVQLLQTAGGAKDAKGLTCSTDTLDSDYVNGVTYYPKRVDCTCFAPTKRVVNPNLGTCADTCKAAGLTCDDSSIWDATDTEDTEPRGGRALYAEREASLQLHLLQYVRCAEVAPPMPTDLGSMPALSIDCACR